MRTLTLVMASAGDTHQDYLFYDGDCGLCHAAVRFVLRNDPPPGRFRFASLQGSTFGERLSIESRRQLPDSLVVHCSAGELLTRSAAVEYLLRRLGGGWHFWVVLSSTLPRRLKDWLYDRVASQRDSLFKKPVRSCPTVDPKAIERFDP